jgi:hypothetical protein
MAYFHRIGNQPCPGKIMQYTCICKRGRKKLDVNFKFWKKLHNSKEFFLREAALKLPSSAIEGKKRDSDLQALGIM